jgi:tetratricopeptide (TPR) repeat protein
MSPEQALAKRVVVDHRSDIYSLGVTLYELLTLDPAFTGDDRQELLRQIAFEDPRPPGQINPHIPPDLETIVLKAIRKGPEHRYPTAHDLAEDLRSFLEDKPIKAKPPTWREKLVKWTRRHPAAIWAAILLLLCTAAISTASALLIARAYNRASTETAKAKTVSDLLQEMLGSADAAQAKGADYRVRDLLDVFAADLGNQLTAEPEVEADIRATIGRAYRSLKLPEKAQPHFEKAIELRRRNDGPQSEKLAAVLVDGGWNLLDLQRRRQAESQLNEALAIYRGRGVTGAPLFHALEILQHVLRGSTGREEDAERATKEAMDVARQSGQEFPDQANLLHRYADLKIQQGNFAEAEKWARQSVDMHRRLHGEGHPETAFGLKTLAKALSSQQKLDKAEKAVREALTIFRHQFPEDHPNIRDTMYQLRKILKARGGKAALEALDNEEKAIAMRTGSPDYHIQLAQFLMSLSMGASRQEDVRRMSLGAARTEEAHRHIREAIDAYGRVAMDYPDDLDRRVKALAGYALAIGPCVAATGFAGEVDELNRRLEAELPKLLAAFPDSNDCRWHAAMIYRGWAFELVPYTTYLSTTEHALGKSVENLEKLSLSDPKWPNVWFYLADTSIILGDTQWRTAKPEDAAVAFGRAMEIYHQHAAETAAGRAPTKAWVALNYISLAHFLAANGREDEAAEFVRKAAVIAGRVKDPVDSATTFRELAAVQLRLGDNVGYRETCKALANVPADKFDDLTKARAVFTWCYAPVRLRI